ncbi:putative porin [Thalassolituus sp. LLYu03]|uniref:putative porin n=1 Tax=Thalassolituus sp. LLYu03 TaxID=3421656 RepID=UPI003D2DE6F9
MKFYVLPALATSLLAFNAAQAAEFSDELTFDYMSSEAESYSNDVLMAQLTHYLAPVNTDGGPLAEAAFLGKASSVKIAIGHSSSDYGSGIESSGIPLAAGITFVTPDQPIVLKANYIRIKEDFESPYDGDFTNKILVLGGGYFINDRTLASFSYKKTDITGLVHGNTKSYTFGAKHLADLGNGQAFNMSVVLSHSVPNGGDDATSVVLAADYYPMPTFSVGASVAQAMSDDDNYDATALNLNARAFIRDDLSLAFTYTNNSIGDSDIDSTEFGISVTARF